MRSLTVAYGASMQKVTPAAEDERDASASSSFDHLGVANGSARRDDRSDAGGDRGFDTVGKRKKSVGGQHRTAGAGTRTRARELHRRNAIGLTAAHAQGAFVAHDDRGVGFDLANRP